jgi:P-loop containing NTP hydrolase pore-1/C-terminal domain on Strawberry notch homologue
MSFRKWIDLCDKESGAKLKTDYLNGNQFLFITNLSRSSPKWNRAINELGFRASPNKNFLIKMLSAQDSVKIKPYQEIWSGAVYAQMEYDRVGMGLSKTAESQKLSDEDKELAASIRREMDSARRLGRNEEGDEVYQSGTGRFIYRADKVGAKSIVRETPEMRGSLFIRAKDDASIDECANGFVRSMMMSEVLRQDDLVRFTQALKSDEAIPVSAAEIERSHELIDTAVMRSLISNYETANDAYGDSVRLYEYMPSYHGTARGKGSMPAPLAILAQRLLGNTANQTVVYPNAFDGAAFSFLPKGTNIVACKGSGSYAGSAKVMRSIEREGVTWEDEFHPVRHSQANAMIFNADPQLRAGGDRQDYRDALISLRSLAPDARAVLILAGDEDQRSGMMNEASKTFLTTLYARYDIEDAFEVSRELTKVAGTNSTLRLVSLKNRPPQPIEAGESQAEALGSNGGLPKAPGVLVTCHSWDEVKARVDESLAKASIKEVESAGLDVRKIIEDNKLQRPYIAFSRVGESSTMVPKELQQPLQAFMSDLEDMHGPVDDFVRKEMGFAGDNTLESRFSPEQVDALGMIFHRMKQGRGHILGDETGIGKGRTLAGVTTWALKQGRPVVFVTDRANLFSDLARDLRDIGEWGRVKPFVMNADGRIEDSIGDAGVLAQGIPASEMKKVLQEGITLEQTGCNVIFTTYSQISGEDSPKSLWLKNQLKDAMLIVDEAHIASGSDSNISAQVAEMTSIAWNVQYSSATWAKSASNLHIFARAFPESVNVGTLSQTMRRGGEAFSEIFSSMLAREGALIRREHDLSKLEFVMEVDQENSARNIAVADKVSVIMSSLAYTAGALKKIVTRMSDLNVAALRDARDVRINAAGAQIFKSRFGTGGMLYQINRRVNAALNVDNAVRLAQEGIAAGRKPVIVFEDTGEAFIKQAMAQQVKQNEDGTTSLPEFLKPPTIKDLLRRIVENIKTVRVEEVALEDLPDILGDDAEPQDIDGTTGDDGAPDQATAQEPRAATDVVDGSREPLFVARPVLAPEASANGDGQITQEVEPAPATVARTPEDEGISVAEMVAQSMPGRLNESAQGADALPVKAKKRKFKNVPFWEIQDLSEADRNSFDDGLNEIYKLIDSLPDIALNAADEIARRLTQSLTPNGDKIRVGELSGRTFSLQAQEGQNELCRIVQRPKSKAHVTATVRAFNGGSIDVLLINRSAATGISLHASPRFADRRRRQLIEIQIPENPTDRVQLYGRVNRFDQESFPLMQVASTGIFAEVRQWMVQNKKIAEMSSNTRSSRDSHVTIKDVRDLLNPIGREVCRQYLEDNIEVLSRLDLSPHEILPESGRDLAQALTQRAPLLLSDEQKQVYEQLYAMFDDAITQAEMMGQNPLRPNELDVRAKVGKPNLMFGFDHKGIGSSFDGAVFAQRLDWTEDVHRLPVEAILEIIRENRRKLVANGKATQVGETAGGMPIIDISALAKRAVVQLEGRARLAVAGTEFKNSQEALQSPKPNAVRRGLGRAKWVADNLHKLVPGRMISMPLGGVDRGNEFLSRSAVILDIIPPADKRESQLAQWRVVTLAPHESKPVSTTLNTLIGRITVATESDTLSNSERSARAAQSAIQPAKDKVELFALPRLQIGGDFIDSHENELARIEKEGEAVSSKNWFYREFKNRTSGVRERRALVLTGNMYLASEWAAQTKAGAGVIFTDERGARHRGILLKDTFRPEWLKYMPARLWMPGMIDRFVKKLMDGEVATNDKGQHVMYGSFDGAWKATESSIVQEKVNKDKIVMIPGQGLMMHVGKESRRRINVMLRQAQKDIKEELFPGQKVLAQNDPGHVMIKESAANAKRLTQGAARANVVRDDVDRASKGESEFIVLRAETPEKMHRAFQMLMRGPGLEIFVPPAFGGNRDGQNIGQLAKNCMRDYYVERLTKDAQGDPVRLARLQELLDSESESNADQRALDVDSELRSFSSFSDFDSLSRQMSFDIDGNVRGGPDEDAQAAGLDAPQEALDNDSRDELDLAEADLEAEVTEDDAASGFAMGAQRAAG